MKIGSQAHRSSAISSSNEDTILVRGRDLCAELIGRITFTDHVWLLVTGGMPSEAQRRVLDATLVAIAEHGLVPSVQASRMTLAAAPEALQGAVAAGILGCGSVILGASENAGRLLHEVASRAAGSSMESAARQVVSEYRDARRSIPGYGHPLHKSSDPRALRLLEVAKAGGLQRSPLRGGRRHRARPAGTDRQAACDERVRRHSRSTARCRLSTAGAEGCAASGAHREFDRASAGRAEPAHRLRALACRRRGDRL